jgi:hypothetical protein
MQIFVNGWIEQARRYEISSELILVEWNPPPDRPRLAEALNWPDDFGPCEIRIFEVPPEIHRRYGHADALPLYQMIAKNAGIRRARGRFILATNIDILFSNELAAFFGDGRLEPGRMYRIDRHDVESDVPASAPVEQQLEYCRTHRIRCNAREGTFQVSPLNPGAGPPVGFAWPSWAWWRTVQSLIRKMANEGSAAKFSMPVPPRFQRWLRFYIEAGGFTGMVRRPSQLRRIAAEGPPVPLLPPPAGYVPLHTNGCGDFTLLAREHWFDLRGYPEFDLFSMNLDSLLCFAAHHSGAREEVLGEPMRIYHIEHGSGWTPEGQAELYRRIAAKGLSFLSSEEVYSMAAQMRRLDAPMIFNSESWGLAGMDLRLTIPRGGGTSLSLT